jgi:hypothetical protein
LLDNLILSAYIPLGFRPLNWGVGGPECWPEARPYLTHTNGEDHIGFRIYDWYQAHAKAVFIEPKPIFLFGIGHPWKAAQAIKVKSTDPEDKAGRIITVARLLSGEMINDLNPVPAEVKGGMFWLLSAEEGSAHNEDAWFKSDGQTLTFGKAFKDWAKTHQPTGGDIGKINLTDSHPIAHYLLLPSYDWGISDWHLEAIRPFIKRYQPTIGFSIEEAQRAARVTVVGSPEDFPEMVLSDLRRTGSLVERIDGNGTSIATQLANR